MKKILIIGGDGYIGSRLQKDLVPEYELTILDSCWFSEPSSTTIQDDFSKISKGFVSGFDVVILLAGHSSVNMCEGDLQNAFRNNIENFLSLVSKISSTQKFIYASSSSVYGNSGSQRVDETYTDFIPHNHYDITKHVIDLYINKFDIEYYSLRFGTVNGFSPRTRSDVMINSMIFNGKKNGSIKLYVKDVMRPILGISDLVSCLKKIIENKQDLRGIYNLASFNMTAEQIAKKVSECTGFPIEEIDGGNNPSINSKLQTKSYNFSIDCGKFEKAFDFKFSDSVESVCEEIISNFEDITFSNRSDVKKY
jgi:nucleoside-diphosphate-sugar epimerase